MPGWLRSAGSGPLTWMLSNATSTAWISQHQRKGRQGEDDAAQTANETFGVGIMIAHKPLHGSGQAACPVRGWLQTSKLACHPGHPYRNGVPIGQPWRLHPGRTCIVTSTCTGYAIRPKRAIDGRGLSPHKSYGIVGYSYLLQRIGCVLPARSPGRVLLWQVPFGQTLSLHPLRDRLPGLVRGLLRYYWSVRLPRSVRHRRASLDFPMRPEATAALGGRGISRFPCEVFPYVLGVSDRAGLWYTSRYRCTRWSLPHTPTASASRSECLSRLNTRPARSPVNASTPPSRAAPHDSGPMWVATPLSYYFFIHYTSPVLTGAQGVSPCPPALAVCPSP